MYGSIGCHGDHNAHVGGDLHVEYLLLLLLLLLLVLPVGILIVVHVLVPLSSGPSRLRGSGNGFFASSSRIIGAKRRR